MNDKARFIFYSILLYITNLTDWALTKHVLTAVGGTELNPIVNSVIINSGFNGLLWYKIGMSTAIIAMCAQTRAVKVLSGVVWCMMAVCAFMLLQMLLATFVTL